MAKFLESDWWKRAICYEIYPASFQDSDGDGFGDLKGIESRLDYLESLRVDCIWLTPVYASPMRDNGYDVEDFYRINPRFGTMDDMDSLIRRAAERGIRIVMDLVFNHVSDKNAWFVESKSSRENPKSDWFVWKDPKPDGSPPNNWRSIFGGSAWTWCEERWQFYLHTFGSFQPDLNWDNPDVRKALADVAKFWIRKGIGGFRLDAVPYIKKPKDFADGKPDASDGTAFIHDATAYSEGILDYLREFKRNAIDGTGVFTVAEANGLKPSELKDWVGSRGAFDMLFEFNHLQGGDIWYKAVPLSILDVKRAIFKSQEATAIDGWYPIFFENHDKPRSVNAYFSERADTAMAGKALITLLLTLRGTPFVYEGEELGMENVRWDSIGDYLELNSKSQYAEALAEGFSPGEALGFVQKFSRDNARTPMQWDSSKNAGFSRGKPWIPVNADFLRVNVERESEDPDSPLSWFRKLSAFRSQNVALLKGKFEALLPEDSQIFAFRRTFGESSVTVLVNLSENPADYDEKILGSGTLLFSSCGDCTLSHLRPLEANVFIGAGV